MRASEFLADLVRRLESLGHEYALVGSIAAMSYGEPRATLDIASMLRISPDEIDLERIRRLAEGLELGAVLDRVVEAAEDA